MKNALIVLFALIPTMAFASVKNEIAKIDRATQACLDKPENQNTYGMNACISEGYDSADRVLNFTYRAIVKSLETTSNDDADTRAYQAEILRRLVAAERTWIAFRDAQSELDGAEMLGGSGEGTVTLGSLFSATKKRAIELSEWGGGEN